MDKIYAYILNLFNHCVYLITSIFLSTLSPLHWALTSGLMLVDLLNYLFHQIFLYIIGKSNSYWSFVESIGLQSSKFSSSSSWSDFRSVLLSFPLLYESPSCKCFQFTGFLSAVSNTTFYFLVNVALIHSHCLSLS